MKITSFNPQIITRNAEPVIKFFEELGFEKRHQKKAIGELDVTGTIMKNADGFGVDVSETYALPQESLTVIRINVDDFDEAYKMLTEKGFKNFYGNRTADHPSSKSAIMISTSGFAINLIKHIKKET